MSLLRLWKKQKQSFCNTRVPRNKILDIFYIYTAKQKSLGLKDCTVGWGFALDVANPQHHQEDL